MRTRIITVAIFAIIPACTPDDPSSSSITWVEPSPSAPPEIVGDETPAYHPPPYVDLSRLQAAMAAATLPEDLSFVRGIRWRADSPPPGEPRLLHFFGNMVTVQQQDGRTLTHVADLSAEHHLCFGYPLCVVTLNTNGSVAHHYLHFDGRSLAFGECVNLRHFPRPTEEELQAASAIAFWESESALCFTYLQSPRYVPYYPAPNDRDPSDLTR